MLMTDENAEFIVTYFPPALRYTQKVAGGKKSGSGH